jgi:hypothetical protein
LCFEELVEAGVGERGVGLVPVDEEGVFFVGVEEWEGVEWGLWIGAGGVEEVCEVTGHASDGVGVEEGGVELEAGMEGVVLGEGFVDVECEVEFGGGVLDGERGDQESGERDFGARCVLECEEDLEERGMADGTRGLQGVDQDFEGEVLLGVSGEGGVFDALDEVVEGGVSGQVGPEDEGVDEHSDQAFDFEAVPVGDGRADADVVGAGISGEQGLESGQEDHEQGGALGAGEGVDFAGECGVEVEREGGALVGLEVGSGAICGQLEQGRGAMELAFPEVDLVLEDVSLEIGALPVCEVGVLDGERRERGVFSLREGLVEESELPGEDADGPSVGDDVVQAEQEDVVVGSEPEEPRANERGFGEVERGGSFAEGERADLGIALVFGEGEVREVEDREREGELGLDQLRRSALDAVEARAQRLVPAQHFVEAVLEGANVEVAFEPEGGG